MHTIFLTQIQLLQRAAHPGGVEGNLEFAPSELPYWPESRTENKVRKWYHSDICKVAFFYVNSVFQKIVAGENQ